ncbi:MAG: phosphoglucomutase/phosphomannomutase family protein [Anaerolineaceae bacterium]|nr:phosphoglucomutase/phosphomannomutase family protein [Anaerolineaceae bacterium]
MTQDIKFGTDGWRAAIAKEYTFESLSRCAQGFASYMIEIGNSGKWLVVGYDRRFLSEEFAKTAASVLAANGFKVHLTNGASPTPVISFSVKGTGSAGAINITASHNPPTDNGFKVRDNTGGAINPAGLTLIESLIPDTVENVKTIPFEEALETGKIEYFDPSINYIKNIERLIDLQPIRDAGLKVLVDPMWGNGAGWFERLLGGSKTEIIEIHSERNPIFPEMQRPEPIPPNANVGLETVTKVGADVLIVNDGDADRIGIGDEKGNFINQLQVFALLAYYLLEIRGQRGAIVKTLSTTNMLFKLAEIYDVPIFETGVGFKYVAPKFTETDAIIGGEESGGYAFRNNVPERDGILAGIYFLDLMIKTGLKPSELIEKLYSIVGPHFYDRIDTRFSGDRSDKMERILNANPETIGGLKVTGLDTTDGFKFNLEDGGWLLIRFSGTEPIIRVYTETTMEANVPDILKDGLKIAGIES